VSLVYRKKLGDEGFHEEVCTREVCVRRKWPSCLILSKELPHLFLLQHNRAPGTSIVFPAPPESTESLPPCLMVLEYHWEKQTNTKKAQKFDVNVLETFLIEGLMEPGGKDSSIKCWKPHESKHLTPSLQKI